MTEHPCSRLERLRDKACKDYKSALKEEGLDPPDPTIDPLGDVTPRRGGTFTTAIRRSFKRYLQTNRDLFQCYEENEIPMGARTPDPCRRQ